MLSRIQAWGMLTYHEVLQKCHGCGEQGTCQALLACLSFNKPHMVSIHLDSFVAQGEVGVTREIYLAWWFLFQERSWIRDRQLQVCLGEAVRILQNICGASLVSIKCWTLFCNAGGPNLGASNFRNLSNISCTDSDMLSNWVMYSCVTFASANTCKPAINLAVTVSVIVLFAQSTSKLKWLNKSNSGNRLAISAND